MNVNQYEISHEIKMKWKFIHAAKIAIATTIVSYCLQFWQQKTVENKKFGAKIEFNLNKISIYCWSMSIDVRIMKRFNPKKISFFASLRNFLISYNPEKQFTLNQKKKIMKNYSMWGWTLNLFQFALKKTLNAHWVIISCSYMRDL